LVFCSIKISENKILALISCFKVKDFAFFTGKN